MMNSFHNLLDWFRDPLGHKRLHERHRNVRVNMMETAGRTEEVTKFIQSETAREMRRKARAQRANAIERVVLGQPRVRKRKEATT